MRYWTWRIVFVWSCGSRGAKAVLTVLSQTPFSPFLLALACSMVRAEGKGELGQAGSRNPSLSPTVW